MRVYDETEAEELMEVEHVHRTRRLTHDKGKRRQRVKAGRWHRRAHDEAELRRMAERAASICQGRT